MLGGYPFSHHHGMENYPKWKEAHIGGTHVPCPWLRRKSKQLQSTDIVFSWDEDGTCLCAASWWKIFSCEHWHPSCYPAKTPLKIRPKQTPQRFPKEGSFTSTLFFRGQALGTGHRCFCWTWHPIRSVEEKHQELLERLVFRLQKTQLNR